MRCTLFSQMALEAGEHNCKRLEKHVIPCSCASLGKVPVLWGVQLFIKVPTSEVPLPKGLSGHGAWPCPNTEHRRAYTVQHPDCDQKPRSEARPAVPTSETWCCQSLPGILQLRKIIFPDCSSLAGFAISSFPNVAASSSPGPRCQFLWLLPSVKAYGCSDNCRVILRLQNYM